MEAVKVDDYRTLTIVRDEFPENPRDWDNVSVMVCFHNRYALGDKHDYKPEDFAGWDELEEQIKKDNDVAAIFPLYIYDHSGISLGISKDYPYNDPWDAGQVGFVYVTKDVIKKELGAKRVAKKELEWARARIIGEVEEYNRYLLGDIWGFEIKNDKGDVLDSCFGFFGDDPRINGMYDHFDTATKRAIEPIDF
jgi:hypothetical protein